MPRVTKADLEAELASQQTKVRHLESELRVERALSAGSANVINMMHNRVNRLEKENEDLKARVRRGCDRSRSPRMPAASSDAAAAIACKAFAQVGLWQRDAVVEDQKAEILRLREEVARLRRGEGPVGEVLAHIDQYEVARLNIQRSPDRAAVMAEALGKQTRPVHEVLRIARRVLDDTKDFLTWGGPLHGGDGAGVPRTAF